MHLFFFFQAEDGIRDYKVTGVQTCALPICESVAQIVTFGKMFPRAATRDAARVLGHEYGIGDRLAKLIPDPIMGRPPSFADCLKEGEPLAAAVREDATAKQIVDVAQGLEGIVRN